MIYALRVKKTSPRVNKSNLNEIKVVLFSKMFMCIYKMQNNSANSL